MFIFIQKSNANKTLQIGEIVLRHKKNILLNKIFTLKSEEF